MVERVAARLAWRADVLFDPQGALAALERRFADEFVASGYIECATSGSSGVPKVIRRSLRSWEASFEVNTRLFGLRDAVIGVPGAMAHSLTLYAALEAAWAGAGLVDLSALRPDRQLGQIAQGVTHIYATPAQAEMILKGQGDAPCLRQWIIGGGRLADDLRTRLLARFPQAEVAQFYGASETSFITLDLGDAPAGSVGRAYPEVEIHADEAGELWIKSPYLFECYAKGSSSETVWREGYLSVGEVGHVDAQGFVYVRGRKGRVVQVLDQLVSPEPAEAALAEALGGDVAVVPRADARRGARLWAMIGPEVEPAEIEAALVALRRQFGALAAPAGWQRVDPFPRLQTGKPDLKRLAALL